MFMENLVFNKTYAEYRNKNQNVGPVKQQCNAKVKISSTSSTNLKDGSDLTDLKKRAVNGACC